jgi:hypothetical protein
MALPGEFSGLLHSPIKFILKLRESEVLKKKGYKRSMRISGLNISG